MRIGITSKPGLKDLGGIIPAALSYLKKKNVPFDICKNTCLLVKNQKPSLNFSEPYDIIMIFGGDGSLLRTVQQVKRFETALVSLNMGRLGFFAAGRGKEYRKIIDAIIEGHYEIDQRMMIRCTVIREGKRVFSKRCLNEATIARDALARMISLKTTVNEMNLATYIADGLIIATPTGSTAYSLSAGGPIVSPLLDSIILTPISPHSFTQKPVVLPSSSRIKVSLASSFDRVSLTVDGQIGISLKEGDLVKVKKSTKALKLLQISKKNAYFQTLRKKLNWGVDVMRR